MQRRRGNRIGRPPKRRTSTLRRAAAIVGLLLGSAALWRIAIDDHAGSRVAQLIEQTEVGERDTTQLADGTTVILAPDSRLEVAEGYGDASRNVTLEGEAFFRVSSNAARPFRVRTGNVVTEVLGTAFAVRAYASGEPVRVAVAEGRVAVTAAAASASAATVLNADDIGTIAGGTVSVSRSAGVEPYLGWMDGRLDFDDVTLAAAAGDIERWFDVDITFAGARVAARRVSGRFTTESIEGVLDALALALDLRWSRAGRTITIETASPESR